MVTPRPPIARSRSHEGGFTLVEVALAIGIIAFAFVTLLALLPAGNTAYRRAADVSVCSQIAQRVIGDAQQSDFATLIDEAGARGADGPGSGTDPVNYSFQAPQRALGRLRYFDEQGREVTPSKADGTLGPEQLFQVIYVVNTRVMTRVQVPMNKLATPVPLLPVNREPLALVTVQVAHNPGNRVALELNTGSGKKDALANNLWKQDARKAGIDIFTYSALVGRAH